MASLADYTTRTPPALSFHQARARITNTALASHSRASLLAALRANGVSIPDDTRLSRRSLAMRLAWALLPAVKLVQLELVER